MNYKNIKINECKSTFRPYESTILNELLFMIEKSTVANLQFYIEKKKRLLPVKQQAKNLR